MSDATESIEITRLIFEAAKSHIGAKAEALLEPWGLTSELLYRTYAPVAAPVNHAACQLAARLTGDDHFGAHLVARLSPSIQHAWSAACRAPNLLGALRNLEAYGRIVTGAIRTDVRLSAHGLSVTAQSCLDVDVRTPQSVESSLAVTWKFVRECFGPGVRPRAVHLSHRAHGDKAELERIFCAPVCFEQEEDELLFAPRWAAVAPSQVMGATGAGSARGDGVVGDVTRKIADMLRASWCTAEEAARRLAMSPRTLERRLVAEGTTFQRVKDDVLRSRALAALESGTISASDVWLQLGFADARGFYRAFRRWTGCTPAEYQRSLAYRSRVA